MTVSAGRNKEIGYLEMMRDFRQTEEKISDDVRG